MEVIPTASSGLPRPASGVTPDPEGSDPRRFRGVAEPERMARAASLAPESRATWVLWTGAARRDWGRGDTGGVTAGHTAPGPARARSPRRFAPEPPIL